MLLCAPRRLEADTPTQAATAARQQLAEAEEALQEALQQARRAREEAREVRAAAEAEETAREDEVRGPLAACRRPPLPSGRNDACCAVLCGVGRPSKLPWWM